MEKITLKDLKNSSVYITPNLPIISTKRYKLNAFMLLGFIALYSLIVVLFTVALLLFTPAKQIPFLFENSTLEREQGNIEILEKKIRLLSAEVNRISDINKKLQYAIILGINDSIDTTDAIYDSLKKDSSSNLTDDVYSAFIKVIERYWLADPDSDFFIMPAKGFIIKDFNEENGHLGIDFGVTKGTPVVASAGGFVIFAGRTLEDGHIMIIKHSDDFITIYKHCSVLLKKTRDSVIQGETIALSGNSGYNTSGPHLHFEIWKGGKAVDPKKYLIN